MSEWLANNLELARLFWPSVACGVATAIAGAVLGVFVLLRREALVALALPQVVGAGAAIGLRFLAPVAIPASLEAITVHIGWPTLPAACVAVAVALAALALARKHRRHELLLPCLYVGGLCISFLVIAGSAQHLIEIQNLFTGVDVAADAHVAEFTAPLLVLIAIACASLWRRWLLIAQAPAAARLAGLSAARWNLLFLTLLSLAVLLATNALGVVLVLAMLFLPAASVLPFTRRIPPALAWSVTMAIVLYVAGFLLSNAMNWPLSQSIGGLGFALLIASHAIARVLR